MDELLRAAAAKRRSWRGRYGALIVEARAAEKLKGRARTHAMIRVCRKINDVESHDVLPRGPRLDAELVMELAISRALPGRFKGTCAGCYASKSLPEDAALRRTASRSC
ncbi:MAG: hypothetical protein ACRELB_02005 [Polyangiaceae bacterium]